MDILNIFSKLQFKSQVLLLSAKHFFSENHFTVTILDVVESKILCEVMSSSRHTGAIYF